MAEVWRNPFISHMETQKERSSKRRLLSKMGLNHLSKKTSALRAGDPQQCHVWMGVCKLCYSKIAGQGSGEGCVNSVQGFFSANETIITIREARAMPRISLWCNSQPALQELAREQRFLKCQKRIHGRKVCCTESSRGAFFISSAAFVILVSGICHMQDTH